MGRKDRSDDEDLDFVDEDRNPLRRVELKLVETPLERLCLFADEDQTFWLLRSYAGSIMNEFRGGITYGVLARIGKDGIKMWPLHSLGWVEETGDFLDGLSSMIWTQTDVKERFENEAKDLWRSIFARRGRRNKNAKE